MIDNVSVNKQILKFQPLQAFSGFLLNAASRMETVEKWAFDDLILDSAGDPIGVNDERGTGEERMRVLVKLQSSLQSQQLNAYMSAGQYTDEVDGPLIHLLSCIKTKRFILVGYWLEKQNAAYLEHLLLRVLHTAHENNYAHILRSRLDNLNRLNIIQNIFSDESVRQVQAVLNAMKAKS
jgi:hypothetical protein